MNKVGEFYTPGKIIFGPGGLSQVGAEAKRLGNKVLVVLGRSAMRKSGALDRLTRLLKENNLEYIIYENIPSDPTALVLSRQNLPQLEKCRGIKEFSRGGYIISHKEKEAPQVVLMVSGSEVSIAVRVNLILKVSGITSRVVSVPDREEFLRQEKKYIEEVLGPKDALRVVIEANTGQGWYQLLNDFYCTVFMKSFGKSAPAQQLADFFGFTPEKIAQKIIQLFQGRGCKI
ncbi:unnamed protein product [marine sediment metagenome]|uniref:Uncharacterized protein n=1 Tax=marine sediment metagenome TaxID=412755 RepID=X1ALG0_9ZZZZ